jgi:hypothetical protein
MRVSCHCRCMRCCRLLSFSPNAAYAQLSSCCLAGDVHGALAALAPALKGERSLFLFVCLFIMYLSKMYMRTAIGGFFPRRLRIKSQSIQVAVLQNHIVHDGTRSALLRCGVLQGSQQLISNQGLTS